MRNTCNYLLSGEELDDDEDLNSIERDITDISLEVCYRQIVYFEYPFSFLQKTLTPSHFVPFIWDEKTNSNETKPQAINSTKFSN